MRVLEPSEESEAWTATLAIAADLAARAPRGMSGSREFSLASGDAGMALFFHALAHTQRGAELDAATTRDEYLEAALAALAEQSMDASLFAGFAGVAWALQLIADGADTDVLDPIDQALADFVEAKRSGSIDVISGSIGIGVYLLERLPRRNALRGLAAIGSELEACAERRDGRVTWRTPPSELDATDRERYPEGRYDLGVAHGVPGTIAFLARLVAAGVEIERAGALLDGAVRWLCEQTPVGAPSPRFPYWSAPVGPSEPTRIAWCYGDLGVALSLLSAAGWTGRSELRDYALELARGVARRPLDTAGIIDGGLCHGTSGAAHLFHRLHRATGEAVFGEASRHWFLETLRLRQPGSGIGGFRAVIRDVNLKDVWIDEPEFLNGAAGIGLSLLALLGDHDPVWDRVLLVAAPPSVPGAVRP